MQKTNWKWLLSYLLLPVFMVMTGCSAFQEVGDNGSKELTLKGANNYRKNLVVNNSLDKKTNIGKGGLESLSSSLASYFTSEDLNFSAMQDEVMYKVIEYLNTPYLWGGTTKNGIDCSAFVQTVMYQSLGVVLPRTSYEQSNVGKDVITENLKFGDLLFFDTRNAGRTTHVGIYLSDGYFVHSGRKYGVAVASLNSEYYSKTFLKAKRVIE
jgi:cell wall-associated NlpC family hydrolase